MDSLSVTVPSRAMSAMRKVRRYFDCDDNAEIDYARHAMPSGTDDQILIPFDCRSAHLHFPCGSGRQ